MSRLEEVRAAWHRATEKDRPKDAVKALVELEKLEPEEPRWSQRLGEAHRRIGEKKDAVDAFARAFQRYFAKGFLPRAIAMAKLVKSLDAERGDLLEQSLARDVGASAPPPPLAVPLPAAPSPARAAPPPPAAKAPPPLPVTTSPPPLPPLRIASRQPGQPPPLPARLVKPAPLLLAVDASDDELRFADAGESSISVLVTDFSSTSTVDVGLVLDDDSLPGAAEYDRHAGMATFRLFAALSRAALVALADAAELVEFVPGAMVIVKDERAFALYAVVSGRATVRVAGSPEIVLGEGDIFGESSLLDEGQRQADVKAETSLMTLRIDKQALEGVTKAFPEVEHALFDLLARRLVTNLLHTSPLFAAFEPTVRLELAQKFEVRRAEPGTLIAERGRRTDGLYIILAGNVVSEKTAGEPIRIARGTTFGQSSLLGRTSDVTIRAASEAILLRMPAAGFGALAALYPPALAHLADTADEPLPESRR